MSDNNDILDPKDPFRKLFRVSAMENAPDSLVPNVIKKLEAETSRLDTGKPIISTLGWVVIGMVLTVLSFFALVFSEGEASSGYLTPLGQWMANLQIPSADFSSLPEAAWLGGLAFGIYSLIQLFWMKREFDRQRLF